MTSQTKGERYRSICILTCNNVRSGDLWEMHFVGDKNL
jgi:hypothetical protein